MKLCVNIIKYQALLITFAIFVFIPVTCIKGTANIRADSELQKLSSSSTFYRKNRNLKMRGKKYSPDDTAENPEVLTLKGVELNGNMSIDYYYPYFIRNHILKFDDDETKDESLMDSQCKDPNCELCIPNHWQKCYKCRLGFLKLNQECYKYCPEGFTSDVVRRRCVPKELIEKPTQSSIAYSIGSCKNMCGAFYIQDCSCAPICKQKGNCCFDFEMKHCEEIINNIDQYTSCSKNERCKYCLKDKKLDDDPDVSYCIQCGEDSYLYKGRCYKTCPSTTKTDPLNKTCSEFMCDVPSCKECENTITCKKCQRGSYLFEGKCLEMCPENYRADRVRWVCLPKNISAWYWVYPSKISCKKYCGVQMKDDWDCSCSPDCIQKGDCCEDIDDYCDNSFQFLLK